MHELFIDDGRTRGHSLLSSLNMLIQTDGGSEFTEGECVAWMRDAGFREVQLLHLSERHTAVAGHVPTG